MISIFYIVGTSQLNTLAYDKYKFKPKVESFLRHSTRYESFTKSFKLKKHSKPTKRIKETNKSYALM